MVRDKQVFWVNHVSEIVEIALPDSNVYFGYGTTKSCFGVPEGCIATRNCTSLGTVIVSQGETFEFEMQSSSN